MSIEKSLSKHHKRLKLAGIKPFTDSCFVTYENRQYRVSASFKKFGCGVMIYESNNCLDGKLVTDKERIELICRFNRGVFKRLFRE